MIDELYNFFTIHKLKCENKLLKHKFEILFKNYIFSHICLLLIALLSYYTKNENKYYFFDILYIISIIFIFNNNRELYTNNNDNKYYDFSIISIFYSYILFFSFLNIFNIIFSFSLVTYYNINNIILLILICELIYIKSNKKKNIYKFIKITLPINILIYFCFNNYIYIILTSIWNLSYIYYCFYNLQKKINYKKNENINYFCSELR